MSNHSLLYFYPWVRQGAATNITLIDKISGPDAELQPANVQLPISLWLNDDQTLPPDISQTVRLYGPRDVTGIDPRQIVRMEPHPLTTNFEPNYLPAIEFDSPDFPWLFSPLAAGENQRLRPWIVLVVIKKQDGVELNRQPEKTLPILSIQAPAKPGEELPDLAESDLWVHAQAVADQAFSDRIQALKQSPERTLSRLLCPRRLLPNTAYIACVVPAFEVGRIAAGLPHQDLASTNNETATLKPAWLSGVQSPDSVTLPVYHYWEFSTGENDDFESLVKKLLPKDNQVTKLPAEVGQFKLDIGQADKELPDLPDMQDLPLPGLLQPVSDLTIERPPVPSLLADALSKILNLPADALVNSTVIDPVVAPPIYGVTFAIFGQPQDFRVGQPDRKAWLNQLNLDPRHRVIAALGTQFIQREQESLMAAAWEHIEKIQELNSRRRQAQLAGVINLNTKQRTFDHLSVNDLVQFTAPAHNQMLAGSRATGLSQLSNLAMIAKMQMRTEVPANSGLIFAKGLEGSALRRITRPRGAMSRRFAQKVVTGTVSYPLINILKTAEFTTVAGDGRVKIGGKVTQQSFLTAEDINNKSFNGNDQWPNWLALSESGAGYWQLAQPFTKTIPSIPPEPTADDIGLQQVGETYYEVIDDFQEPDADGGFVDPDTGVPRPRPRPGPLKPRQNRIVISHANVQKLKNQWKENWRAEHPPQVIVVNPPDPTDDEKTRWALFKDLFKAAASKHVAALKPLTEQTHKIEPSDLDLRLYRMGRSYYRLDEDITWTLKNDSKLSNKSARTPVGLSERAALREEWLKTNSSLSNTEALQILDEAGVKAEILGQLADNIKVEDDVSVIAHPVFAYPVYEALLELAPEYILPNLDRVPFNSASLMAANSQFIEAFLVGLNTEMAKEFLWREYPTDLRGTCFHHFWDTQPANLGSETARDIKDIHLWDGALGTNNPDAAISEPVVLLIRGELLQRYPGAIIYAVPAEADGLGLHPSLDQSKIKYPLFRENLPPDVALIGFALRPEDLSIGSGWFIIIKEQPSEPRFGFDKAPDVTLEEAQNLNQLTWGHLAGKLEDLQSLNYIKAAQKPVNASAAFSDAQVEWGKNAAQMARIALQRPFLVAIHTKQLLG
ncbi:MAG: hypothetical protein ABL925_03065 [Methylococcales bacterium]